MLKQHQSPVGRASWAQGKQWLLDTATLVTWELSQAIAYTLLGFFVPTVLIFIFSLFLKFLTSSYLLAHISTLLFPGLDEMLLSPWLVTLLHICGVIPTLQSPKWMETPCRYRRSGGRYRPIEWRVFECFMMFHNVLSVSWGFTSGSRCFTCVSRCITMFYKCFMMFSEFRNDRHRRYRLESDPMLNSIQNADWSNSVPIRQIPKGTVPMRLGMSHDWKFSDWKLDQTHQSYPRLQILIGNSQIGTELLYFSYDRV